MIRSITCFLALVTLTCISSAQDTAGVKTVIFPREKPTHATNDAPSSRFTPIPDEITLVDSIVKAHIKEKFPQATTVQVDKYYRQYYGSIMMSQRIVYVNACCTKPEKFFEEMYFVKGGGNCYFTARVNLQSKKIMSFKFNAAQ
ncbi:MAG: hypothetical protein JNL63_10840 [Bacteroidia bacterium]|nr:hypothetical protein [Bacteroidia bacterium]